MHSLIHPPAKQCQGKGAYGRERNRWDTPAAAHARSHRGGGPPCSFDQLGESKVMNRTLARLLCAIAAFASVAANAQLFRAYLAPNGSDSNACTLAAPCRLLPTALGAVADGGEVWILDSGNYNTAPVNVTKSVTILAVPGAVGSVVATNGNAFDIGTPGVNVVLRNLVIVPLPNGAAVSGVSVTAAASVIIENCLVANMPNYGVYVVPTTSVKVRIDNSTIRGAPTIS